MRNQNNISAIEKQEMNCSIFILGPLNPANLQVENVPHLQILGGESCLLKNLPTEFTYNEELLSEIHLADNFLMEEEDMKIPLSYIYISRKELKEVYGTRTKPKFDNGWKHAKKNVCNFLFCPYQLGNQFIPHKNRRDTDVSLMNFEALLRTDNYLAFSHIISSLTITSITVHTEFSTTHGPMTKCTRCTKFERNPQCILGSGDNSNQACIAEFPGGVPVEAIFDGDDEKKRESSDCSNSMEDEIQPPKKKSKK